MGWKDGEEGEFNSEEKSSLPQNKFSTQAIADQGLAKYNSLGQSGAFPVFVNKASLARSHGRSPMYHLWLLLSYSGRVE